MRALLWLVMALLLPVPVQARPIEVRTSLPHGILYLLESLREEPHHSQHLRQVFLERHPLSAAEEEALAGYRRAMETHPDRVYPLELLAVDSVDVEGLASRVASVLPSGEAVAVAGALRVFERPYREFVWLPCQADLTRQVGELREGFDRAEAPRRLDQVAAFMGSRWPMDRPLRVLLTPIPKEKGVPIMAYGHSNGSLQVSEAPTGAPQTHAPPVLFHEMCHALWREADRERFAAWFRSSPLAWEQLDEGLATALGNGWFGRILTGSLPSGRWYENPAVDAYGRALYPLVAEALEGGGPFDEAFAGRALAAFDRAFPDAWRWPSLVSARMLLLAEVRDDLAVAGIQKLSQAVQLRQCLAATPLASEEARQRFEAMAGGMVVFLLPAESLPSLASYPVGLRAEGRTRFLWSRWTGDRWLVVSVAPTPDERREALVRFLSQERLSEGFLAP